MRLSLSANGGEGPNAPTGPSVSGGRLSCVIAARTPGAAPRAPDRSWRRGRAGAAPLALARPQGNRPNTAESEARPHDRSVFDHQRGGRGGERELVRGPVADLQITRSRSDGKQRPLQRRYQ